MSKNSYLTALAQKIVQRHPDIVAGRPDRLGLHQPLFEDAEHFEGESGLKEYDNPERLLLTEEIRETIYRAIENLPEDLKSAITLREFDGLSYEEIAEVMDCPIGTVRSRIFRARDAIDKELRPLLE